MRAIIKAFLLCGLMFLAPFILFGQTQEVILNVGYVHQVLDMDQDDFLGHNACTPTSAVSILRHYDLYPAVPGGEPIGYYVYNPYPTGSEDKSGNRYNTDWAKDMDVNGTYINSVYGAHGYMVIYDNPDWLGDSNLMRGFLVNHGLTNGGVVYSDIFATVKRNINQGLPLIGHMIFNKYESEMRHYLIIIGYHDESGTANDWLVVNDPYGNRNGTWNGSTSGQGLQYAMNSEFVDVSQIFPVGIYDDYPGWHATDDYPYTPSQPFKTAYELYGGFGFFGAPFDNHELVTDCETKAHVWPTGGNPSSQDVMIMQDYRKVVDEETNEDRCIVLNPSRITAYYVEKGIRSNWLATTGYSTYGAPVGKPESRKYAGGALGDYDDGKARVTIQKFGKIGGSLKTLGYNNNTPSSGGHYPAGKLTLYGNEGDLWYIDDDESGTVTGADRFLFEIGPTGSDWVWIDAREQAYQLMIDPVNGPVNTFSHHVWEGNNQHAELSGGTPPSSPQTATSVTASNVTSSSATISWSDPNDPDAAPYLVSRSDGRVFSVASSPLTDGLVLPGQTYEYTVSVNNGPQSAPSDPVEIPLEGGGGQPGTLQIVSPQPGDVIPLYTYFVIDWNGVPNNDPVQVYLSRDGGDTWEDLQSWGGTASQTAPLYIEPPESDECLIKVHRVFDEDNWDVMDGFFTIGDPNDPPTASNASASTNYPDTVTVSMTSHVTDPQNNIAWGTLQIVSTSVGSAVVNGSSIVYAPAYRTSGNAAIQYKVADAKGLWSNTATLTVDVNEGVYAHSSAFALNSMRFGGNNRAYSGDVMVNDEASGATLYSNYEFSSGMYFDMEEGFSVKADRVNIGSRSVVDSDVHYNSVTIGFLADVNGDLVTPLSLPLSSVLPAMWESAPGAQDTSVAMSGSLTLPAGSYRDVTVGPDATLTLSGGTYHVRNFNVGLDARVYCSAATILRVKERVDIGGDTFVGPAPSYGVPPHDIMFYVEGINGTGGGLSETPKAVYTALYAQIQANIYAPNGTVYIGGDADVVGAVIAKDVDAGMYATFTLDSYFSTDTTMAKMAAPQEYVGTSLVPERFALHQNYPNPFNPTTTFRFDLPEATHVTLAVYNIIGQRVARVTDQMWRAGAHAIVWDASRLSSGVYFYRLEAGTFRATRKLLLMK